MTNIKSTYDMFVNDYDNSGDASRSGSTRRASCDGTEREWAANPRPRFGSARDFYNSDDDELNL